MLHGCKIADSTTCFWHRFVVSLKLYRFVAPAKTAGCQKAWRSYKLATRAAICRRLPRYMTQSSLRYI